MIREAVAAACVLALCPAVAEASIHPPKIGETTTLAAVPSPGFPEGVLVHGRHVYVSGPATLGTVGFGPSPIFKYDLHSGALVDTIAIQGEDTSQEHALSCITEDGFGRLYVLSTQLGVVRVDPRTKAQDIYASPLPILPACGISGACIGGKCGTKAARCAPVVNVRGSIINDLAFDDEGNLYITDSFQATIFRVPVGSHTPEVWYQDGRLDTSTIPGFAIGPNGIRVSPDRRKLFFAQSMGEYAGIWTLPLVDDPAPEELTLFHAYSTADIADGMAFGLDGSLFVALAGANQIDVLRPNGASAVRFPSAKENQALSVPFSNPANVAFDGMGSILVTNHSLFDPRPQNFVILESFVGDLASPLARPLIDAKHGHVCDRDDDDD